MNKTNPAIYLVYFQGPDFFEQKYFIDFSEAKKYYDEQIKTYSKKMYGESYEKSIALIGINDGDSVGSGTWGELLADNIIEELVEFEEEN